MTSSPDQDLQPEDLAALHAAVEETLPGFSAGDTLTGTVARVEADEVLVDVGAKSEGVVPARELVASETLAVGDTVEVVVVTLADKEERLILSRKRAEAAKAWAAIEKLQQDGGSVRGPVLEVVKGGLIMDVAG